MNDGEGDTPVEGVASDGDPGWSPSDLSDGRKPFQWELPSHDSCHVKAAVRFSVQGGTRVGGGRKKSAEPCPEAAPRGPLVRLVVFFGSPSQGILGRFQWCR